jgi:hypothetical protein
MTRLRRLLSYLFILLYLILCPMVILYTLGFRFRPYSKKEIVNTGLVYLSSMPIGAKVFIDENTYPHKTPTAIPGLLPGSYHIRLTLNGYKPWNNTITVKARKATVFARILLIPQRLEKKEITIQTVGDLIPLPGTGYMLLKRGARIQDISVYDSKGGGTFAPLDRSSPYYGWYVSGWVTGRASPSILLQVEREGAARVLMMSIKSGRATIDDLTRIIRTLSPDIRWAPRDPTRLFFPRGNDLVMLDARAAASTATVAGGIHGFGVDESGIYVLKNGRILRVINIGGNRQETEPVGLVTDIPASGGEYFFRIEPLKNSVFLLLGNDGRLILANLPVLFTLDGIRGFSYARDADRLLLWGQDRLGVLDFQPSDTGDGAPGSGAFRWIYTEGKDIRQVFQVYQSSYALFRDADVVYLSGPLQDGNQQTVHLMSVREGSSVYYSEEEERLYSIDRDSGKLSAVEIIPKIDIMGELISNLKRGY